MNDCKNKTILLVEDEMLISMAQENTIRSFGYEVICAHTGVEAISLANRNPDISLILMDIDLGAGISGPEAAQEILAIRHIPIVFLTSHSSRMMVEKVRGITRYGYVIKNSGNFVLESSIDMAFELFDAHEKMRENEQRFQRLAQNAPDVIYRYRFLPDRGFEYVSPAVTSITGYTPDEHYADPDLGFKLVHPEDRPLLEKASRNPAAYYKPIILRWVHKDGTSIWTEQRNVPIFDQAGSIVAFEGIARDITERRRAEEALKESESKYRNLFENMEEGFSLQEIITDKDGQVVNFRIIDSNSAYERHTGLTRTEIIGRTILEIMPDVDPLQIKKYGHVALTGESLTFEYYSKSFNRFFHIRAFRPSPGRFATIFEDITERKKIEEALKKSNDIFLSLSNTIPGYIAFVNADTLQYEYVNDKFEKSFGIPREKIIGSHIKEIIGETNYQFAIKYIDEVKLGKSISYENIFDLVSGKRWIQVNYTPVLGVAGHVASIAVLSYDITDRKRAEEALAEEIAFTKIAINSQRDTFFVFERISGRAIRWNKTFSDISGYSDEEIAVLKAPDSYYNSEDLKKAKTALESIMLTGSIRIELTLVRKDGHKILTEYDASLIHGRKDSTEYIISIGRDITEHKRAEEKINSLLLEKELILKEVHHRIKNNMSIMMSLLSLQSDTLENPSAVAALLDAKSRMQSMLILYDKLYVSENLRAMSIKDYLSPLVEEIVRIFPNSSSVKIEKKIDDFVLGVEALAPLGIMVNELITNAMKYAFPGRDDGVITVFATMKDNFTTIIVQDNGHGIPESIDIESSSGFGLKLVGLLAKQMHGTVEIKRGTGTMFVISFPV